MGPQLRPGRTPHRRTCWRRTTGHLLRPKGGPARKSPRQRTSTARQVSSLKVGTPTASRRYEEHWQNGKQHGEEIHWDEQGQKVEERHWRSGYCHGPETRWYPDGTTAEEATYDRYRLDGTYRTWYRNGQAFLKAEYQKGNRQGDFLAWHPNGARYCQATFSQDRLEGTWQKWDAEGNLLKRIEYREGEIVADRSAKPVPFVYTQDRWVPPISPLSSPKGVVGMVSARCERRPPAGVSILIFS